VQERHKSHDQNVFTGHQLQDSEGSYRKHSGRGNFFKAMRGWGLELWIVVGVENRNNSILVLFEGASVILGCIAFVIGILFHDKLERI